MLWLGRHFGSYRYDVSTVAADPAVPEEEPASSGATAPVVDPQAASKTRSAENLERLAEALHRYHDKHGGLPPAVLSDKGGQPLLTSRRMDMEWHQPDVPLTFAAVAMALEKLD